MDHVTTVITVITATTMTNLQKRRLKSGSTLLTMIPPARKVQMRNKEKINPKDLAREIASTNPRTNELIAGKRSFVINPLPHGKAGSTCIVAPGKFSQKKRTISGIFPALRSVITLWMVTSSPCARK
ncbi:MAG: hypothetical protein M1312_00945, partial [Patescibacteria group bacterium]|nr:hypothetical protein [Patescibacteria group bacterium]